MGEVEGDAAKHVVAEPDEADTADDDEHEGHCTHADVEDPRTPEEVAWVPHGVLYWHHLGN